MIIQHKNKLIHIIPALSWIITMLIVNFIKSNIIPALSIVISCLISMFSLHYSEGPKKGYYVIFISVIIISVVSMIYFSL